MPPRAMWTGQLRLSLVTFGVRLYAATESAKKVAMNQLHKDCHQRLRNQITCPVHGPIPRDEIVKGYAYEKDSYVIITPEDLEAIRLKSTKVIELVQFVDPAEIDPLYVNAPYFLGPDGPVAEEAFRVIREAMRNANVVGLGKVVMHGREQIVAISPNGKGFLLTTLRYASEVRSGTTYFGDIRDGDLDAEQVSLAESIIKSKVAPFDPSEFNDKYQEAFFDIVKTKVEGETPIRVDEEEAPSTFNFIEALKQSVETAEPSRKKKTTRKKTAKKSVTRKKPAAKSVGASKKKTKKVKRA